MDLKNTAFATLNQLGQDCQSKEQVLVDGGLNFLVEKVDLKAQMTWYPNPNSDFESVDEIDFPFHSGIVRTDTRTSLGIMGHGYGLVQNHELLMLTDEFVKGSQARYVAAGAPNRGERVYVVMDTGRFFNLGTGPGEVVRNMFFITSSHDGSNALLAYPSPVYEKDGTVLIYPDSRYGAIKIRHTKNVAKYLAQAEKMIGKLTDFWTKFEDSFSMLAEVQMTDSEVESFLRVVYVPEDGEETAVSRRVQGEVFEIYKTGRSANLPYCKGTLLGVYFACVFHADNESTVRKSKKRTADAAALYSRLMGTQAQNKAEALGFCLRLNRRMKGVR